MAPVGRSPYDGWKLFQRNRMLGMVEIEVCPAGIRFASSLVNGIMVDHKGIKVIVFSDNARKYKTFNEAEFMRKIAMTSAASYGSPLEMKMLVRKKSPGKPILGFKTTKLDLVLKLLQPPYPEFPDQLWVTGDIHTSAAALKIFKKLFELSESVEDPGFPLRWVKTMHINPLVKSVAHDTLKAERHSFTSADFAPPAGYKKTQLDAEVFGMGL